MFNYIKTIEDLNNLSPQQHIVGVIGVIQKIDYHDWDGKNISFELSADDTDITLNCICNNGLNEFLHTSKLMSGRFNKGDGVLISGWYDNGVIWCHTMIRVQLGLTGTMMHDIFALSDEILSIVSVQGQNKYISDNAWGKLQEALFKFRDLVREIEFCGGKLLEED